MATNVGELEATLRLRDELSAQLRTVETRLAGTGRSFDGIGAKAQGFGKSMEGIASGLVKVGGALGLAFGAAGLVRMVTDVVKLGDEIQDLSTRTGIGVEALQRMGAVAEAEGSSMEDLARGVGDLGRRLAGGDDSATQGARLLKLSIDDLLKARPEERFLTIATALGKIENSAVRDRLAVDLLGKSGKTLSPILGEMDEKMKAVSANRILPPETIQQLSEADDKLKALNQQWSVFAGNVVGPLISRGLDVITKALNDFADARKKAQEGEWSPFGPSGLGTLVQTFEDASKQGKVWQTVLSLLPPWMVKLKDSTKDATDATDKHTLATTNLGVAYAPLPGAVQKTTSAFDLGTEMLRVYLEDALYPVTAAQKALIHQYDQLGFSAGKIAEAMRIPEVAIKGTIESIKAEAQAIEDAIEAWEKYDEKQKAVFSDVPGIVQKYYDDQIAIMQAGNQKMIDALLENPLFKGTGKAGGPTLEFNIAEALDPLPVSEMDKAFQELQATITAIDLDPLGAKIERQTVAWAKYNREILQIQSGLTSIAAMGTGTGSRPGGAPLMTPQLVGGGQGYQLPTLTGFASGGIVTRPTMGLVGEAGPEAIIPLGKMGGTNINVSVNVSNSYIPTGSAQFGRDIFAALNEEMKHHGIRIGKA
jgi:predicted DNA-binding protein YlxM (UPF0122 family)